MKYSAGLLFLLALTVVNIVFGRPSLLDAILPSFAGKSRGFSVDPLAPVELNGSMVKDGSLSGGSKVWRKQSAVHANRNLRRVAPSGGGQNGSRLSVSNSKVTVVSAEGERLSNSPVTSGDPKVRQKEM